MSDFLVDAEHSQSRGTQEAVHFSLDGALDGLVEPSQMLWPGMICGLICGLMRGWDPERHVVS